jgi:hypothetical protein
MSTEKKKFIVEVREVWVAQVEVEAADKDDAIDLVRSGKGDHNGMTEYSHSLGKDTWTVREVKK